MYIIETEKAYLRLYELMEQSHEVIIMKKVIVIGCGAAGMMAAIALAEKGCSVEIYEKNDKPGKKLFITGKGRCNITNNSDMDNLLKNVVSNPKFLFSAFSGFDANDCIDFFENIGLKTKTERGDRVFPLSDHSSDVISVLTTKLKRSGVEVHYMSEVLDLIEEQSIREPDDRAVTGIRIRQNGEERDVFCDHVVVATGGVSYPRTGSTGDGIKWARGLGLKVTEPKPALVPLCVDDVICKELMGLSLKNVNVSFETQVKNKVKEVYSAFGEMIFTHFGVSGPVILSASSYLHKYDGGDIRMYIDFKPALTKEQLDDRILRDFEQNMNKQFRNSLSDLLPKKLIPVIIDRSGIEPYKKVNEVTRQERERLVNTLKHFELKISGYRDFDEAIITQGGVSVKEINPQNMNVKKIKGISFVGEVLDVDALTGGFNLQIAWSTGRAVEV